MPTLGSPSTWRTHPHIQEMFMVIYKPEVIFSCSVNQTEFTYPVAQLTYDTVTVGAYTDIALDQLVRVKDSTGVFKGWGRVRLTPTSSILYIGHVSDGEISFANKDIIEVLDDFRPFAKIPRDLSNGTLYKDYDLVYSDQGSKINPKCNAGGPVVGFIGDDDLIHADFDLTTSIPVASGATISSYGGSVIDGTVETGSIASGVFTASFPTGKRWCNFTVTDSNSKVGTVRVPVVALTGRDDANLYPVRISSHDIDIRSGASIRFTIDKLNLSASEIVPGSLIILFTKERYGNTDGSLSGQVGRENVCFMGWLTENSVDVQTEYSDVEFTAVDIIGKMAQLPAFPISLFHKASPTKWYEIKDLSLFRMMYYLLLWHSNIMSLTDFLEPDWTSVYTETPKRLDADAGSLLNQMQMCAGYLDCIFLADKSGILRSPRNPQFLSDVDRSSVVTTVTLQTTDYTNAKWTERHTDALYWLRGSGVIADNTSITAKLAISPGTSPSQGSSESTLDRQLILDQADLNVRTGRKYTLENNDIPNLQIDLLLAGRVIDLAYGEFVSFNLPVTLNRRQTLFSNSLFIPSHISIDYDESGISTESVEMEPVIYGVSATTQAVPVDKSKDISYIFPTIDTYDYMPPSDIPILAPSQAFISLANAPFIYAWTPKNVGRLAKGATTWEHLLSAEDLYPEAGAPALVWFRLHPWYPKDKAIALLYDAAVGTGNDAILVQIDNLNSISPSITSILSVSQVKSLGSGNDLLTLSDRFQQFDLSININGFLAITLAGSARGSVYYRRSDSDSWHTSSIVAMADGGCTLVMGHHAPSPTSGRMYAISSQPPGFNMKLYVSTDNGANWSEDYSFGNLRSGYANAPLDMPYEGNLSDLILYAGMGIPGYSNSIVRRNSDSTYTAISPSTVDGYWGAKQILSYTYDHAQVVLLARSPTLIPANDAIMYSTNSGSTWGTSDNPTAAGMPVWIGGWPYDSEVLFAITPDNPTKLMVASNFISGSPSSVTWDDITYDFYTVVDITSNAIGLVPVWTS